MRLYLKLAAMFVAAWVVHGCVLNDWRKNEVVFGVRCLYAQMMEDQRMLEGLVEDAEYFIENDSFVVCAAGGGSR